jgi:polysaccharide export outer membrane protein
MPARPETLPGSEFHAASARRFLVTLMAAIAMLAAGCTSASDNTADATGAVVASPQAFAGVDGHDQQRLAELWRNRTQGDSATDYKLGPGDVLQISSPDIDDLKDRTERIGPDGTISLPYAGTVRAAGMTESALRDEVRRRLGKYVISPQVDLFVKDYQSRKVVVVGSVERPGLYDLSSGHDTIFDMITRAGGMKDSAAQRVLLITEAAAHPVAPGGSAAGPAGDDVVPASNQPLTSVRAASYLTAGSLRDADPIVIDLKNLERGGNQLYLAMPARPGDIIVIPDAGEVLVQGWVQKPGNYKITSGMTLMGAIAAAGGALFAADTTSVKILRSDKRGEKQNLIADLKQIENRSEEDVELHGGDVVTVPYSTAKIGPYAIYSLLSRAYVGASAPFIP